ncbi:MAG: hypothetical protein ACRETW_12725 [Stenotrophobium sp.]
MPGLKNVTAAPTARTVIAAMALMLTLLVLAWAYWPGLSGSFLLDDDTNLAALGDNGGIHDWRGFVDFVTSGNAGPLGRPVSLASFAANAQDWPTDPKPFKLTNLLLHLLNTLFVFAFARQLLAIAGSCWSAFGGVLCAAIWGLHPLQVSAVLYVVQRMTELETTFSLLGLIMFVHGRVIGAARPVAGYAWMACGIGLCGLLATLSKESGALLPLFALCLEFTLLSHKVKPPPQWLSLGFLLLWFPVLLLAGYLVWDAPQLISGYTYRDFSLGERLLTEGRVLVDYLHDLVLPNLSSGSLFYDNFVPSHSLLNPISTLWSWLLIVILIVTAFAVRHRHAVLALGVLWYFAGQALESTAIPLELYFEHRNYLPSLGLALIASFYGLQLLQLKPVITGLAIAAFLGMELWITHQQAHIWGNDLFAVEIWPAEHPNSLRAQQFAARYWMTHGSTAIAQGYLDRFVKRSPDNTTARLQDIELRCSAKNGADLYAQASLTVLRTGTFDIAGPDTLNRIQGLAEQAHCADLKSDTLMKMIDAYAGNPIVRKLPSQLGYVYFIKASALAAQGQFDEAVRIIDNAAQLRPTIFASYWQARWMLQAHKLIAAHQYFAQALDEYHQRFGRTTKLDHEMATLQQEIFAPPPS